MVVTRVWEGNQRKHFSAGLGLKECKWFQHYLVSVQSSSGFKPPMWFATDRRLAQRTETELDDASFFLLSNHGISEEVFKRFLFVFRASIFISVLGLY